MNQLTEPTSLNSDLEAEFVSQCQGKFLLFEKHSTITKFTILRLSADPHIQALRFVLFLGVYFLTLMKNLVMLLVISADSRFQVPMYFFLGQLSFLDICYFSVSVPKLLENLLSKKKAISVAGCMAHISFVSASEGVESFLFLAMAHDHYVDICHSLVFSQVMRNHLCVGLLLAQWGLGFLDDHINIFGAGSLEFCETHTVSYFSCELPSLFPLACSTNLTVLAWSYVTHSLGTVLLIFFSCARIVSTILSINSTTSKHKDFSACSSYLTVVSCLSLRFFT
ncbi:olfactory receptor 8S1-like [Lagenorhynchus albirostris]|uniref:olfactory receptor 8S1-like n=1 Tax=Lagenorhynchus albirostris TaxID=27610 RepID=UPI0028EDD2EF|nr:olfactory receptor 8S1-like [Lagenorhynchus albirostris]